MGFSDNGSGYADPTPETSLVEDSASLVDELRQMQTDAGLRPYRIFSVIVSWSGGELYRGDPSVICEKEFLPTPFIDLRPMYSIYSEVGVFEHGDVLMTEVSPSLSEDQIRELCFNGQELKPNHQGFIEVRHDSRKQDNPRRRRFTVRGVPWHDAARHQWIVTLSDEESARSRNGELVTPVLDPPKIYRPT